MEFIIFYYRRLLNNEDSMASSRNRSFMLREAKMNGYLYFESNAPTMFDKVLEKRLIQLIESMRLEKIKTTNDPKYCKYHMIIDHSIEKCKAFKEEVMQLIKEGKF